MLFAKIKLWLQYGWAAVLALVLEACPWSAALDFGVQNAAGAIEKRRQYVSGFSVLLLGYGSYAPFLTGILTAAVLVALAVGIGTRGMIKTRVAMGLAAFAALFSLFPLFTGSYTPVGLGITAALIAECFLLYRRFHTSK